jgi:FixJ family two-component response regulator
MYRKNGCDEPVSTIFVIDGDATARDALGQLMRCTGYAVRLFPTAEEFLYGNPCCDANCLVLEIRLPGLDGLTLQERLGASGHCPPVVVLTGDADVGLSVRAMKGGAVDFLVKPCKDAELLRAVRLALEKDRETRHRQAERTGILQRMRALTFREYQVLTGVVNGKLNKQIAADLGTTEKTVKFHRGNMMRKMCARSVVELVRSVDKAGVGSTL